MYQRGASPAPCMGAAHAAAAASNEHTRFPMRAAPCRCAWPRCGARSSAAKQSAPTSSAGEAGGSCAEQGARVQWKQQRGP